MPLLPQPKQLKKSSAEGLGSQRVDSIAEESSLEYLLRHSELGIWSVVSVNLPPQQAESATTWQTRKRFGIEALACSA